MTRDDSRWAGRAKEIYEAHRHNDPPNRPPWNDLDLEFEPHFKLYVRAIMCARNEQRASAPDGES